MLRCWCLQGLYGSSWAMYCAVGMRCGQGTVPSGSASGSGWAHDAETDFYKKMLSKSCRRKPFSRQPRRSLCYRRFLSTYTHTYIYIYIESLRDQAHFLQGKNKAKAICMLCWMAVGGQPGERKLTDRCSDFSCLAHRTFRDPCRSAFTPV